MKNKSIIAIRSRHGDYSYLKRVGDEDSKSFELVTRYSYRGGKIGGKNFIDPSGGPMIIEGEYLEEVDAKVKSIKNGIITFE